MTATNLLCFLLTYYPSPLFQYLFSPPRNVFIYKDTIPSETLNQSRFTAKHLYLFINSAKIKVPFSEYALLHLEKLISNQANSYIMLLRSNPEVISIKLGRAGHSRTIELLIKSNVYHIHHFLSQSVMDRQDWVAMTMDCMFIINPVACFEGRLGMKCGGLEFVYCI